MADIRAANFIGGEPSSVGDHTFWAHNPVSNEPLEPVFTEAIAAEIDKAAMIAHRTFDHYRLLPLERRASLLEAIADEIMNLGDTLLNRAELESGLPQPRLVGERSRTVNQLKMFAEVVRQGDWQALSHDEAIPDREPVPKPDLKRVMMPLGPVAVFGASNFPLAFSVAGGDTASALAAGCPVIVKGHPAHPGTSDLTAQAVYAAINKLNLPRGIFSLLQGNSNDAGCALVTHPMVKAVGFTGSLNAGRHLYDLASQRREPIPVFAEMGSTNPMFILPSAIAADKEGLVKGLTASMTLGVGQFCTQPGLIFVVKGDESEGLINDLEASLSKVGEATMLHKGIKCGYENRLRTVNAVDDLYQIYSGNNSDAPTRSGPVLLKTSAETYLTRSELHEEIFGPASIIVVCESTEQWKEIAEGMGGQLTATLHAPESECADHLELIHILERKAGRLIFNGYPTGVEVCASMTHGGPYPATTDSRGTSVGTSAINRFLRPISYQNFPESLLPSAFHG
jgi:NADP-dependent aldehyde dehydrogenase